jgi:hypothetical protein
LLNIDQRHIGSIPAAIFRLTFGPRPCGTYACTASATYGTADNGIAPHAEEFCAIASIDSIVVITTAQIRLDFGSVAYRGKPLIAFGL